MLYSLSEIETGKIAIIQQIEESDVKIKLMEMGCMPGEPVIVETVAPFGDPIAIRVSGYVLSLRKNEAKHIKVAFA